MDSAGHRLQAERFDAFLKIITSTAHPHQEWRVVVCYYSALHYVDAVLTTHVQKTWDRHDDRLRRMAMYPPTAGGVQSAYHRLQKLSREARYDGTPFTAKDVDANVVPLFHAVREPLRNALGLNP